MPRTMQITVPESMTDELVSDLRKLDGILGIRLQRSASVEPAGDVIDVDVLNRHLPALADVAARHGIGSQSGTSLSTSQPVSVVSLSSADAIANDLSEATWEEMDLVMAKESNTTFNGLVVMAIAGLVATLGIAQNSLHVVVGAMVIAPGFEPIVRAALGVVARSRAWRIGLRQLLEGYAALVVGAVVAAAFLAATGNDPRGGGASYLPSGVLIEYWTTISATSVLIAFVGGVAGAVLVAANRSVLTAGVMIALALVPGASVAGIGVATADLGVAAAGALRWAVDVVLVGVAALAVLEVKRRTVHRRTMR